MARKIVLLVIALGAGVGFAWYWRGSQSTHGDRSVVVPAEPVELAIVIANPPAPSNTAHSSSASPTNQSFELSPSVQANCRLWEGDCKELDRFLERMKREPRNTDWARAMEARIEKAVISGERGKFRIRALECRSTRCALEVASEVDSIGVQFDSDPAFDELMFERPGYHASESDPQTGATTLVTAQTWQTTESFEAEEDARD